MLLHPTQRNDPYPSNCVVILEIVYPDRLWCHLILAWYYHANIELMLDWWPWLCDSYDVCEVVLQGNAHLYDLEFLLLLEISEHNPRGNF